MRYTLGALLIVALLAGFLLWQTRSHSPSPAAAPAAVAATAPTETARTPATDPQAPLPPAVTAPPPPPPAPAPLPAPSVTFAPASMHPGDIAVITVRGEGLTGATATVTGLNQQPRFFALDGRLVALVAVPAETDAAGYPMRIRWQRAGAPAGQEGTWEGTLRVAARQFVEDRMTATKEQNDVRTDPRQGQDAERVAQIRSKSAPAPLWSGAFLWPVRGEISTEFGAIRFVNGEYTGQHTGLDIESKMGTPVLATAAGKVVLAEPLIITGNTVIIDHGLGLFSLYAHMSSLSVRVGDSVVRGAVIGKVGSTGWSTSPHLHWTMSVGNVPVDPRLFADKTLMDR